MTDVAAPDDSIPAPEEGAGAALGADALSVVLPPLLSSLQSDEAGREVLRVLTADPAAATAQLGSWLKSRASPTMATVVTGGFVEKLVNIAHADVVQVVSQPKVDRPAQLPNDIPDFTDRIAAIELMLTTVQKADTPSGTTTILSLSGVGGAGKTALAVHVSHLLRETHPDAQLYVNLRGPEPPAVDPADALDGFLRALGVEGPRIPAALDERARMYRVALADQRAVVLLDNAADEQQVRPLIPGGGRCVVVVTSRRPLPGLEGAVPIPLDVLEQEEGVELLAKIVGEARSGAEPEAAKEVVRLCGGLPLAIRIAGAKLVAKPHWRIERLVSRLQDERDRLDEFSVGDLDVRGTFMLSYRGLTAELQRAFRLSGHIAAPDFAAWTLAAALECDSDTAEELAESLVEAQLFEVAREDLTGEIRYRLHDLLRAFARERSKEAESEAERHAAVERMLGALLGLARRGLFLLSPHSRRDDVPSKALILPPSQDLAERLQRKPYAWFESEYDAIIAGISQAHGEQLWECTWELAEAMHYFFRVRARWKDWQHTHELALDAAQKAENLRGEGWTLRNLGNAHRDQFHIAEAERCFARCLGIFRELGNRLGEAAALNNLGELAMDTGHLTEAVAYFDQCLPAWSEVGDRVGVAYVTNHLGVIRFQQGRSSDAHGCFDRSRRMFDELGDQFGTAHALRCVAELAREEGRLDEASDAGSRSIDMFAELGDRLSQAWARFSLARVRLEEGQVSEASELLSAALETFREFGDRRGQTWALLVFGETYLLDGRHVPAAAAFEESAAAFQSWGERFGEGVARYGLGRVKLAAGDAAAASSSLEAAAVLFQAMGAAGWQARVERERERASGRAVTDRLPPTG